MFIPLLNSEARVTGDENCKRLNLECFSHMLNLAAIKGRTPAELSVVHCCVL